jgi:4-azaleucine resistance transporter AzlC
VKKDEPRWLEVLKIALPLCLSYVPIGLACGILLNVAGFNTILTGLASVLVFSGGAQFLIASMLTVNAPLHTILIMLFFLELRYALLGSSISQYLHHTSKKFLYFFAVSLNDENYAVNYLKFATDKAWTPQDALMVEHYSLLFWTMANIVGSLIGNMLTDCNASGKSFNYSGQFCCWNFSNYFHGIIEEYYGISSINNYCVFVWFCYRRLFGEAWVPKRVFVT